MNTIVHLYHYKPFLVWYKNHKPLHVIFILLKKWITTFERLAWLVRRNVYLFLKLKSA